MIAGSLQASSKNRGIVFDPRTKFFLLITMSIFVLGGAGGEIMGGLMPVFCAIPAIALLSAKKFKRALGYTLLYCLSYVAVFLFSSIVHGFVHFLIMGIFGIVLRFLPCLMMGAYLVSTTTVSEFTAAMLRMHISEKIIIPLSVMFRFFPTVLDEFQSINTAMKMRGIRFGSVEIAKMIEYRLVPLMTCCVKIGEELSAAALTRGLGGDVKRTNICKIGFHSQDYTVVALCLVPYVLLVLQFFGLYA